MEIFKIRAKYNRPNITSSEKDTLRQEYWNLAKELDERASKL